MTNRGNSCAIDVVAEADQVLRDPDASGVMFRAPPEAEALREAAVALDRARSKLRLQDPNEALSLWRALVSGQWTLFDHYESDGRRVLIARRNEPHSLARSNLARRTSQVLAYRALGYSLKFIAYELGLSTSTVHREVSRGLAALGMRSPVELVLLEPDDEPVNR